jgi:molecular chaperone GrpE
MSEKKPPSAPKPGDQKSKAAPKQAAGAAPPEAEAPEAAGWAAGEGAEAEAVLEALQVENADLTDRLLRAVAEMENLRRRTEREKSETAKYAVTAFARDVLSVGDNIARTIDAVPENEVARDPALKALLEGVQMTDRELLNILERHGIRKLVPKGERFDPNRHQAMFEVENKDVPAGTIVEVVQAGYVIEDRILRPAMVGIAKGGEKLPKPAAELPTAANDDSPQAPDSPEDGGPGDGKVGINVDKSA